MEKEHDTFSSDEAPTMIRNFLISLRRLQLKPSEIIGKVFVIGQAQLFPERGSLLLPDDFFTEKFRPEVKSMVGGRFICSGSHSSDQPVKNKHWQVERFAEMSTIDADYPFYGHNLGVVYRRVKVAE